MILMCGTHFCLGEVVQVSLGAALLTCLFHDLSMIHRQIGGLFVSSCRVSWRRSSRRPQFQLDDPWIVDKADALIGTLKT